MIPTKLFKDFFSSEKTGGLILISLTILSLVLANSPWQEIYTRFWNIKFLGLDIVHWINEGVMTFFFLLIGLELEREIYEGELNNLKNASLPILAAIGGMVIPAGIFLILNSGTEAISGAGIPMATDIAFAIGILSLLGNRVPVSMKIFLTALAVIDDLGSIIIIAIFYTDSILIVNVSISLGIFGLLLLLNRLKVQSLLPYLTGGVAMWFFMLHSGIHPTITGVLLAFAIPFRGRIQQSASYKLHHFLHKPVAFVILPLFALANTGIILDSKLVEGLGNNYSLGIIAGLLFGKPLGILIFAYMGVRMKLCKLPAGLKWRHITGMGFLGGIGFTMSIFIALLAFDNPEMINTAKIAVFIGSITAGLSGLLLLKLTLKVPVQ